VELLESIESRVREVAVVARSYNSARELLIATVGACDGRLCSRSELDVAVGSLVADALSRRLGARVGGLRSSVAVETVSRKSELVLRLFGGDAGPVPKEVLRQVEVDIEKALSIDVESGRALHGWPIAAAAVGGAATAVAAAGVTFGVSAGVMTAASSFTGLAACKWRRQSRARLSDPDPTSPGATTWAELGTRSVPVADCLTAGERVAGAQELAQCVHQAHVDPVDGVSVPLGDVDASNAVLAALSVAALAGICESLIGGGSVAGRVISKVEARGGRGCAVMFVCDIPTCVVA